MSDIMQVLEAVNSALNVIKRVAETPGVNMLPYATTVSTAIAAVQTAYSAGVSVVPYVVAIKKTFDKPGIPAQSDLDALDAKIDALEAKVQAPLPPKEDGEPD